LTPTHRLDSSRPDRIPHLDTLRGLGILLVVGMHANGYTQATTGTAFDHLWSRLAGVSVPLFYVADGYLFARSVRSPGRPFSVASYLANSARRLLVPWVVFNGIYAALRAAFECYGFFPTRLVVGRPPVEVLANVVNSQVAMQMYFLAALFLIRTVAAFALRGVATAGAGAGVLVAAAVVAVVQGSGLTLWEDPLSNAVFGLQYFLIGVAFLQADGLLRRRAWAVAAAGLAAFVALYAWEDRGGMPAAGAFAVQASLLTGEYALFLALGRSPEVLAALGRRTMPIYLLHGPVLLKALQVLGSRWVGDRVALCALMWAGAVLGSLAVARLAEAVPRGPGRLPAFR
jgi:peptidoglycan/LPS O-acetylase OafA/YrhL